MTRSRRIEPGPGQESVWDYPRPPRLEPESNRIRVIFNGKIIAETGSALRVLETSHPPTYYIPPEAIVTGVLVPDARRSLCEWKGQARYFDVIVEELAARQAAWSYPDPTHAFIALRDHVAFHATKMDACFVGDERAKTQAGDFYGGWITRKIVGPFKGPAGTQFW